MHSVVCYNGKQDKLYSELRPMGHAVPTCHLDKLAPERSMGWFGMIIVEETKGWAHEMYKSDVWQPTFSEGTQ